MAGVHKRKHGDSMRIGKVMQAVSGSLLAVSLMNAGHAATAQPPDVGPVAVEIHDSGLPADWAHHAVFMEIYVRGWQDSNGDGVGDLAGVTQRLDYLKSLGVGAIWLMPIYPSADHDHGYAVTNYRNIAPEYGTLEDFDRLIRAAHQRGIAVILDYVINHSADTHPLFEDARAHADSPWRNWYVWSQDKPQGWTTYGGDPWHTAPSGYYYGAFSYQMPDFNFRNPDVLAFHLNNLKFWMNRGVDGFRFDAVGALVENGPEAWENQPENHQIMASVQTLLSTYGNRYMVAEAPAAPVEFSSTSSAGSAFAFGLQEQIIKSIQFGRVQAGLVDYLQKNPVSRMGTFLSNHDSFAGARLYQQFDGDEASYKAAAATLLTLPGIPFIYYGEEIGQSFSEPVQFEDQRLRGPMSWNADGSGFSTARPFRPLATNAASQNVAAETDRPDSLLNTYRTLIGMRNHSSALSDGAFTLMSHDDDAALVFTRSDAQQQVWVAINYASAATTVNVPPGKWHALAAPEGMAVFTPGPLAIPAHQWLVLQRQLND